MKAVRVIRGKAYRDHVPGTAVSHDINASPYSFGGFRLAHDGERMQRLYGWAGTPVGPPSISVPRAPGRVDQRLGFRLAWAREGE